MADKVPIDDDLLLRLMAPGERLGWVFRDRNLFRLRYLEPPPVPEVIHPRFVARAETARERMPRRIGLSVLVGIGLATLVGCCSAFVSLFDRSTIMLNVVGAALSLFACMVGVAGALLLKHDAVTALSQELERLRRSYHQSWAEWESRRADHQRQQQAAVDLLLEWGAATPSPGSRRVDIVGGTSRGWEGLLTVFGGSLLTTRGNMMLVDFTGEALCGPLANLAAHTGSSIDITVLPSQVAAVDLAADLEPRELIDCLVESMYGDSEGSSRSDRHRDTMLLTEICEALGEPVTIGRIVAGLRVLTDRPAGPTLTAEEQARVYDLWPDETRGQAHGHMRRLEAFLRPLESMGAAERNASHAQLACLVADRDGRGAHHELLKDLIVQWLIRRVGRETGQVGSVVLIGADEVRHSHLERLSVLCERRGVRLALFFVHLREQSLHLLGGGDVAFMRLGNHQEAQQAAEYIGRQHKFTLTQLTRSVGGSTSRSVGQTEGWSGTVAATATGSGSLGVEFLLGSLSLGAGASISRSYSRSNTESITESDNWSYAASSQRVYEYMVEPRVLQDLPDYALLLIKQHGGGSVLQAVECDPAIVTLPRVTMDPLPYMPLPDPTRRRS